MKMKKTSPLNYVFAIGKIRALEKFLIREEAFEEAIELSLNDALKLFVESDLYSDELLHIKDSRELEDVLNKELLKLKKLISSLIPDKGLLSLLELNDIKAAEGILLKKCAGAFLNNYLRHLIDMHNIKSFLRFYFLKEPGEELKKHLSCGGFIKIRTFTELYTQDISVFLNRLEYVRKPDSVIINYSDFLREAVAKIQKDNSFLALEKTIGDFLISILKSAKYISFGPEPLIAYYFAKVNEINLLRMIILAKVNNVADSVVKERRNLVYA